MDLQRIYQCNFHQLRRANDLDMERKYVTHLMGYYKKLEILDRYIRNGRGNMNIPPIY